MSLNIKNGDELIPVAGTPKVTRSSLELENVDNTADLDKPVSTATQAALDLKADITDLDKKANKTFIEAVDSDTNVVTVPNDVAGFAAISKISGKTHKTVNLFDINSLSNSNVTKIDDETIRLHNGTYDIMTGFKSNTVYTLSAYVRNLGSGNVRLRVIYTDGTEDDRVLYNASDSFMYRTHTTNSTKTISAITCYYGSSGDAEYKQLQVQEGETATPYEPYGELWSAPVKSVVSCGKNLLNKLTYVSGKIRNDSGSEIIDTTSSYYSGMISVNPNETLSSNFVCQRIYYYDSNKNWLSRSDTLMTNQFTVPSNAYYIQIQIHNSAKFDEPIVVKGNTIPTAYSPYNKTTVSIPDEVRNCEGYGLSITRADGTVVANEIDFENGVFHRRVASVDLGTLTWTKASNSPLFNAPPLPNARNKNNTGGDGLCSKYSVISYYPTAIATDDSLWYRGGSVNSGVAITDNSYADATSLTNALKGQILIYELDNEETIDISSVIYPFQCESGGTIEFVNEHNLDINNTVLYKKEVL